MKVKKGFLVRQVGGENVAVPVGETCKQFHGMIKLNGTALNLWNFFLEEHDKNEAVEYLMSHYEVEQSVANADVERFVDILVGHGILV